jgi:hypothetical protein
MLFIFFYLYLTAQLSISARWYHTVLFTGCSCQRKNRFRPLLLEHEGMKVEIYTVIKKGIEESVGEIFCLHPPKNIQINHQLEML